MELGIWQNAMTDRTQTTEKGLASSGHQESDSVRLNRLGAQLAPIINYGVERYEAEQRAEHARIVKAQRGPWYRQMTKWAKRTSIIVPFVVFMIGDVVYTRCLTKERAKQHRESVRPVYELALMLLYHV